MTTLYGDVSPEVAGYIAKELLERGMPYLVLDRFGQAQALPSNETKVMNFFRYNALPSDPVSLMEGVTPAGRKVSRTQIAVTLAQYGDYVEITDVVKDTADDTVIQGTLDVLSQQAAEMAEKITINEIKAGTNIYRAGAVASRNLVNSVFGTTELNRVVRGLLRQNAKKVTKMVRSTPDFNTDNVHPSFVAIIPVELISTVRGLTGFIDAKDYGQISPYPNEIGAVNEIRFLYHTLLTGYAGLGASGTTYLNTGGVHDVFPIIVFGADSYANVALRGEFAITPQVVNPKPVQGDPLGQRGSIGWKSMRAAKILNDAWLAILETCAPI